jgi:SRSO17 transposase
MIAEAPLDDGVWVLDDPGIPKQGKPSIGVARQDLGTMGTVGYCQLAVTWCYGDPQEALIRRVRDNSNQSADSL